MVDGFIEKAETSFKDKKGRRKERKDKKKDKNKSESENNKKKDHPSKLEAGHPSELETDKRNGKQKKTAFDKGMKLGAAVVNNENLNNHAIKIELNQLELKYKLKELDGKLISEKEDLQTWILSGKLDTHKGSKTIERKPTKADSKFPRTWRKVRRMFLRRIVNCMSVLLLR